MNMKYVDEYRDPELAKRISSEIAKVSGSRPLKLMEVCGGHTHTIYKHGIEDVLPHNIDLIHGPGCPVCVLPMGRIDDAIAIARMDDVIFTTFGDMMRVPGSKGSLLDAKADGADVRFVYSPLDALTGERRRYQELLPLLQPCQHHPSDEGHTRFAGFAPGWIHRRRSRQHGNRHAPLQLCCA